MRLLKMIKHDCIEGVAKRSIYYVLPIIVSLISCMSLELNIISENRMANVSMHGNVMDYWIYMILGNKPYKPDFTNLFHIPMAWMGFYCFLLIGTNNYIEKDLSRNGFQMILCAKSRLIWWTSKVLWLCIYSFFYFLICGITVMSYVIFHHGSIKSLPDADIMELIGATHLCGVPGWQIKLLCIGVPALFMLMLGILQMFLSLMVGSMQSFMAMFGVMVASTYHSSVWLPGNWGILRRSSVIIKSGISLKCSVSLMCVMILLGLVGGYCLFRRKDIL